MSCIIDVLPRRPGRIGQSGAARRRRHVTYGELAAEIDVLAERLRADRPRVIAILADNGRAWALADLAAHAAGIPTIPLPLFFSAAQIVHVLRIGRYRQVRPTAGAPAGRIAAARLAGGAFYGELQRRSPAGCCSVSHRTSRRHP
jgi:acyl-CoA synthetase (AMP-forming)/AMP-acid ligase II